MHPMASFEAMCTEKIMQLSHFGLNPTPLLPISYLPTEKHLLALVIGVLVAGDTE